jgi:hypothetical protein
MIRKLLVAASAVTVLLFWNAGSGSASPTDEQQVARATLKPVDQGTLDPSFSAFRTRLSEALKTFDVSFLVQHSAEELHRGSSHWGGDGADRPTELYAQLERAIRLGGSFSTSRGAKMGRREFCAPYVFSEFPDVIPDLPGDEIDNEGHPWAIVGRNVAVRRRPQANATVIRRLTHFELVSPTTEMSPVDNPQWYEITTPDALVGWVRAVDIMDPADTHVCFAKFDTDWKITEIDGYMPGPKLK